MPQASWLDFLDQALAACSMDLTADLMEDLMVVHTEDLTVLLKVPTKLHLSNEVLSLGADQRIGKVLAS